MVRVEGEVKAITTGFPTQRGNSLYLRVPNDWKGHRIVAFVEEGE